MEALQAQIDAAQAEVSKQGEVVRSLKAGVKTGSADKAEVDAAIEKLKELKLVLEEKQQAFQASTGKASAGNREAFRQTMTNTLERRLFFIPSFKIYGSVAGFYDFGPPGCAVKQNITQFWRQHFVLEENMLELECPAVTPEVVLQASGHVERFTDFMVTDLKTGDCHRADHLLEDVLEKMLEDTKNPLSPERRKEVAQILAEVGEMNTPEKIGKYLTEFGVKAPDTGNDISAPFAFNLMFKTSIGPKGDNVGFLRPETAQGIFVNFRDLLYYNGSKLPFAAAQIGNSYRNEISPRAGLLRVREFTQAEIEHFVSPDDKSHPKFGGVADVEPRLFSRELQMGEEKAAKPMRLGEAVERGIIANETLAYFIGRCYLFMLEVGINPERCRFRQHLQHEMAHYAADCWDCEVECSYGWVECVGLADRSAYDLNAHAGASKVDLTAYEQFPEPRMVEVVEIKPDKKSLGKDFKRDAKAIGAALEKLPECDAMELKAKLDAGETVPFEAEGTAFDLRAEHVSIKRVTNKQNGRSFTPSVIEPSFGIGRIMYCMFEHCFYTRQDDENKGVFAFKPHIAPTKATVFPLLQKPELNERARAISAELTKLRLSNIIDTTGTGIGKRYARTDELGVPFAVTVDYETVSNNTVTLRERDSTSQVRVPAGEVPAVVRDLVSGELKWDDVTAKYPAQATASED
uniref:Glycine--tRNA ligase n=1 Tax=Tetraselmis sp. GSL018 TaxID=582737 RepID=A0A061R117_9CHLO|mmetsp:Transcript_13025/g.30887  ORF Transcript_13025/g.30887 Transcript_13025/m.30887 type:complete len:690 (+) Transcript_13025:95-2164(+)